jgi:hypothetical protein
VVSADLPSVRPFSEVVRIVHDVAGWEAAIADALAGQPAGSVHSRRAVARRNGWDERAVALEALLQKMALPSDAQAVTSPRQAVR